MEDNKLFGLFTYGNGLCLEMNQWVTVLDLSLYNLMREKSTDATPPNFTALLQL